MAPRHAEKTGNHGPIAGNERPRTSGTTKVIPRITTDWRAASSLGSGCANSRARHIHPTRANAVAATSAAAKSTRALASTINISSAKMGIAPMAPATALNRRHFSEETLSAAPSVRPTSKAAQARLSVNSGWRGGSAAINPDQMHQISLPLRARMAYVLIMSPLWLDAENRTKPALLRLRSGGWWARAR